MTRRRTHGPLSAHDFARLVDAVEQDGGRDLPADLAGPQSDDAVDWIREFTDSGRSMPLATPPSEVGDELRRAFRRVLSPGVPDEVLDVIPRFDERNLALASGMRHAGNQPEVHYVTIDEAGVHLTMTLIETSAGTLDAEGHLTWEEPADEPTELVFVAASAPDRRTQVTRTGDFVIDSLARANDELRIMRGTRSLRARLDLANNT